MLDGSTFVFYRLLDFSAVDMRLHRSSSRLPSYANFTPNFEEHYEYNVSKEDILFNSMNSAVSILRACSV